MIENDKGYAVNVAPQNYNSNADSTEDVGEVYCEHPFSPDVTEDQFGIYQGSSELAIEPLCQSDGPEDFVWPEPRPVINVAAPEPYPIEALPESIRGAVEEVIGYVQAPIALAASCALSSLSLACQAVIDVQRDERLNGPTGLFFLTVANSGERKSSCDAFFSKAIKEYEAEQREKSNPELQEYLAMNAAWESERSGLLAAIKKDSSSKKPNPEGVKKLKAELVQLEKTKPEKPRVPDLLRDDSTPEDLGWRLANEWPSAGIIVSEAGIVFGSHGMGQDSVMRNLGALNVYWDGGDKKVGRRTTASYHVRGARLTMSLMTQEETIRAFSEKSGQLARGTGFFARFLISWPESTQGTRFYRSPPTGMPKTTEFNRRIIEILNRPVQIGDGGLINHHLPLSTEAKAEWIEFHDSIERELGASGDYYDISDVAAKIADNAARIAALFHLFEHNEESPICFDCMQRAALVALWHLHEARRFFGELSVPQEISDAMRLERWLLAYCRELGSDHVSTREAMRRGPVRDRRRFDHALRELGVTRVHIKTHGRQKHILINPALIRGNS